MIRIAIIATVFVVAGLWVSLWGLEMAVMVTGAAVTLLVILAAVLVAVARRLAGYRPAAAAPSCPAPMSGWEKFKVIQACKVAERKRIANAPKKAGGHRHRAHGMRHVLHHMRHR